MLPAAILAGGLATRLRPLTETIPKSLVPINGEPFISHQLRLLKRRGIDRVVLCVGYLGEMIEDFLGGSAFGLDVQYSADGLVPLGTAGAIRNALPLLGEGFFTIYGDSYLTCDYASVQDAFLDSGKPGLMTVFRNEGLWDTSNVEFSQGSVLAYDKQKRTPRMRHIDYGLGIFHRSVFDQLPSGPCDLATIYQDLTARNELAAFEVAERFYETGSFGGIQELSELLSAAASTNQTHE
jgi:N-acetyl-alpha-D-muramate 1-phosphate uridylyltransferase